MILFTIEPHLHRAPRDAIPPMKNPCLLIADSHEIARQGYAKILRDWRPGLELHEASDLEEARSLLDRQAVDLFITEVSLFRQSTLELIQEIRAQRSGRPRVLISTSQEEGRHGLQALQAGAAGFVCKSESIRTFLTAVDAVLGGRMHASDELLAKWKQGSPAVSDAELSERERAILQRLAQGLEAGEISEVLSLSIKTVRDYRQRLMDKLNLHSLADLMRYGVSCGLVDLSC